MWFMRRTVKISWTDKVSNEREWAIAKVERKLSQTAKKKTGK